MRQDDALSSRTPQPNSPLAALSLPGLFHAAPSDAMHIEIAADNLQVASKAPVTFKNSF